jgi:hypothetical protein
MHYNTGKLFHWLCSKEIVIEEIAFWEGEAAKILCQMEMHLPPIVLDIQFHLVVHLPGEVRLRGPMAPRWMYFVKRYMAELKGWIRQRARLEGSMAQGYLVAETMFFVSEYSDRFHSKGPKLFDVSQSDKFNGIVLPKARVTKVMTVVFQEQAWRFLFLNAACLDSWRQRHASAVEADSNTAAFKDWLLPALTASTEETREWPSQMIWDLAVGPSASADFFTACWVYGRHFRVASRDLNKKTTFDCSISQWFEIEGEQKEFIGYIDAIVRLDFDSFEIVLIKAKWYNSNHSQGRSCTLLEDECGHLRVKMVDFLPDTSAIDEPFAFPKDVEQFFFVDDWIHNGWKLAIKVQLRVAKVYYTRSPRSSIEDTAKSESSGEEGSDPNAAGDTAGSNEQAGCSRPVSTEADDSAGKDVDVGESKDDGKPDDDGEGYLESDDEGDHS